MKKVFSYIILLLMFGIFIPINVNASQSFPGGTNFKCTFISANYNDGINCDMSPVGQKTSFTSEKRTKVKFDYSKEDERRYYFWGKGWDWNANVGKGIGHYYSLGVAKSNIKSGLLDISYHINASNSAPLNTDDISYSSGTTVISGNPTNTKGPSANPIPSSNPGGTATASSKTGGGITSNPEGAVKLFFAFDTMFSNEKCEDYKCWITLVWSWATMIMLPLSIIMLIGAGALYATSAGNPDRISLAKKIIIGVLSGLVLIVLARVLLINFVGLSGSQWNV